MLNQWGFILICILLDVFFHCYCNFWVLNEDSSFVYLLHFMFFLFVCFLLFYSYHPSSENEWSVTCPCQASNAKKKRKRMHGLTSSFLKIPFSVINRSLFVRIVIFPLFLENFQSQHNLSTLHRLSMETRIDIVMFHVIQICTGSLHFGNFVTVRAANILKMCLWTPWG